MQSDRCHTRILVSALVLWACVGAGGCALHRYQFFGEGTCGPVAASLDLALDLPCAVACSRGEYYLGALRLPLGCRAAMPLVVANGQWQAVLE